MEVVSGTGAGMGAGTGEGKGGVPALQGRGQLGVEGARAALRTGRNHGGPVCNGYSLPLTRA